MYDAKRGGRSQVCAATRAGEEDLAADALFPQNDAPFSPDKEQALTRAA